MVARVFVSRELPGGALKRLAEHVDLDIWPGPQAPTAQQLQSALSGCDALLCMLTDSIDEALIKANPQLRVISSCSVGVDHIDVHAASAHGIPVGHTPHVLTEATADLSFALLLSAARRLNEADQFIRNDLWTAERRWEPSLLLGRDLKDATLGILGLGPIGQAMARRAAGFGMRILAWTPSGRQLEHVHTVSFDEVVEQADFLSLHLALVDETHHIINSSTLNKMKRSALLINTARGGLVDEQALVEALNNQHIAGAALDVFEHEPIHADHPLLGLAQVTLSPHIGSATWNTRCAMADLAVDNLLAALKRQAMPYCVNPQVPR